jgi:hypothetical protein
MDTTIKAFIARCKRRSGNYETDGHSLWLFGNEIASWQNGKIRICDAGYRTFTTKKALNEVLDQANVPCRLAQERHVWKAYCAPDGWDRPRRKKVKWPGCLTVRPR